MTQHDTALALRAGEAAAEVLPAVTELTAAGTQPGTDHVTASFAGAATAQLVTEDGAEHRVAVLVGQDLVTALKESPLGGLDLAAATQPAFDAVAKVLGAKARAGVATELALVVSDLSGPFTVVPLIGEGIDAAVLISDALLPRIAAAPAVEAAQPVAQPATEPTHAAAPQAAAPTPTLHEPVPSPAEQLAAQIQEPALVVQAVQPAVHQQFTAQTAEIFASAAEPPSRRGIEMLAGVDMEVTVELGRTRMAVRDLLALSPGTVLELDRAADGPADLLVNGRLIARGEVVVVDEDFGLRITEIIEDASA